VACSPDTQASDSTSSSSSSSSGSETDDDGDDEDDDDKGGTKKRKERGKGRVTLSEVAYPRMRLVLSFLDLACKHLRLGVLPVQLIHWAEEGTIPYLTAWQHVPPQASEPGVGVGEMMIVPAQWPYICHRGLGNKYPSSCLEYRPVIEAATHSMWDPAWLARTPPSHSTSPVTS
jgi:hypothetical protein